jgi:hypothetical protein
MTTQPEALLLAEKLEQQFPLGTAQHYLDGEAAAELRRLHAENKRLETLCYDYLGELTAMRAVEHMRKQRKPLTYEEIDLLAAKHAPPIDPEFGDDDWIEFARAIERAHGIGGEA